MKKIFFILSLFIVYSYSQVSVSKISDESLKKLFNEIEILGEIRNDSLIIRICSTSNEPGSAGFSNGEITNNIFVAVSEYGEYPNQSLFRFSPMYAPKLIRTSTSIYISYIEGSQTKYIKIHAQIDDIKIIHQNDKVQFISEPCVILYQPSQEEIDTKSQNEESGFNEMISDFMYYSEKIKPYLDEEKIKVVNTSAEIISVWLPEHESVPIFTSEYERSVGYILVNSDENPKVMPGVHTDVGLIQEINKYYNLK